MTRTPSVWEGERLTFERSVALTIDSVCAYGSGYRHWAIASSGGKDTTTTARSLSRSSQWEPSLRPKA
jgi:hypothetical protein